MYLLLIYFYVQANSSRRTDQHPLKRAWWGNNRHRQVESRNIEKKKKLFDEIIQFSDPHSGEESGIDDEYERIVIMNYEKELEAKFGNNSKWISLPKLEYECREFFAAVCQIESEQFRNWLIFEYIGAVYFAN